MSYAKAYLHKRRKPFQARILFGGKARTGNESLFTATGARSSFKSYEHGKNLLRFWLCPAPVSAHGWRKLGLLRVVGVPSPPRSSRQHCFSGGILSRTSGTFSLPESFDLPESSL